ncbi:ribonuclease H-like domain-containing protein [Xylariaceae sp. FL1272]|nr:ribonuclease H-like domain-containing protein [Xylariaceae sp. FL1272]
MATSGLENSGTALDDRRVDREKQQPWPLRYRIEIEKSRKRKRKLWWSFELYKGPNGQAPSVLYAASRPDSEKLARKFLQQKILGFDMEWISWDASSSSNPRLQERVSLIQLACEDKIALFHLGVHAGNRSEDILAPSLRRIIESPAIVKVGSNIMGDFGRLEEYFDVEPQGAIELSHLHNVVTYGSGDMEDSWTRCTTRLFALAKQVETHLQLPLKKGRVVRSDWCRKNLTKEQRTYAASDAYASFILYHHLELKRVAMDQVDHPLLYAERYKWFKNIPGLGTQLLLVLSTQIGSENATITVRSVMDHLKGRHDQVHRHEFTRDTISLEIDEGAQQALVEWISPGNPCSRQNPYQRIARKWAPMRSRPLHRGNPSSKNTLLSTLKAHREKIARQRGVELYAVANNDALQGIARIRPRTRAQLMEIKGVGKKLCDKWGDAWLNMVDKQIESEEAEIGPGLQQQRETRE